MTFNLLAWGFFRFFEEVVRAGRGEEFRLVLWVSLGLPFVPVCETLPQAVGVPLWLSNPFVWAAAVEFGLRRFLDRPRDGAPS